MTKMAKVAVIMPAERLGIVNIYGYIMKLWPKCISPVKIVLKR